MTLIVIPIGSALLLLAVLLLFLRRPKSKTDWPAFIGMCLLFATVALASWAWQYSKFLGKHGVYYLSPKYGGLIVTVSYVAIFTGCVAYLWKHRNEDN